MGRGVKAEPPVDRPFTEQAGWFHWRWLLPLLIVVAGLIAYSNSFSGDFLLDDDKNILNNARITSISPLSRTLSGRRPVVDLSLAINYHYASRDSGEPVSRGFHAFNLAVHLLAGLVLFGVVRRTLLLPSIRARFGAAAPWLALATALIWTVHPLQTQSVTYLIQRAESMMALFYLLTLYCVIRGAGSRRAMPWFGAAVVFCALGMGGKAVMVTAPVVVLLYDRIFLSKSFGETFRRRGALYVLLAMTWGVLAACGVAEGVLSPSRQAATVGFSVRDTSPSAYLLTQPGVIAYYLRLAFWPHPLCLDYNWPLPRTVSEVNLSALLTASLVLVPLLAATIWGLVRKPRLGFVGAWFFLILAPTSSIVPIKDAMFEHRMYLPLAAVVLAVVLGAYGVLGWLLARHPQRVHLRRVGVAVLVAAVVAPSMYGTFQRNKVYRSDMVMWTDVLAKSPNHPRGHLGLGTALFELGSAAKAREATYRAQEATAEAKQAAAEAVDLYRQAEEAFANAVRFRPDYADGHYNLGNAKAELGKLREAEEAYYASIRLRPRYAKAHYNLGNVLKKQRRWAEAIEAYQTAVRIKPTHISAHINLGNTLREEDRLEEAVQHYRKALKLNPQHANAHYNLGMTLKKLGRPDEAIRELELAFKYDPNHPQAKRMLDAFLAERARSDGQ